MSFVLAVDNSGNAGVVCNEVQEVVPFDRLDSALRVLDAVRKDPAIFDKFTAIKLLKRNWNVSNT